MRLGPIIASLGLLIFVWQSPQDLIRQHYESAEAQRLAVNLTAVASEYTASAAEGDEQFGDQPQLHVVIGRAYRQSGLLSEAAEEFKRAVALDPHFPRAHYYLGITYLLDEGQSKIAEAAEEFKIEMAANPDEFFANYYL